MAKSCLFVNVPPLPKTKYQLQKKNKKLRKELSTVRHQYREKVYKVVENFKRQCDETKYDITPSYGKLKELIKSSTSDEIMEGCRVPEHKHSVQNKGIKYCSSTNNIYDAVDARYGQCTGALGLRQTCAELAGYVAIPKRIKDVTEMHKAEIDDENDELKHYIECYDHMFVRARRQLSNLRQEYEESKQYLPPKRYPLLKEMVKTVVGDKKLMPDGFDD